MCAVSRSCYAVQCAAFDCGRFLSIQGGVDVICVDCEAVHEVESIFVIYESVAVIVHIRLACNLSLVPPYCIGKVFVTIVHGAVENGHDNARVASCEPPCLLHSDISTGYSLVADASVIVQVPLVNCMRVVECNFRRPAGGPGKHEVCLESLLCSSRLDESVELYSADTCRLRQYLCSIDWRCLRVESDHEPLVEAIFPGYFSIFWLNRDGRSEGCGLEAVQDVG